MVFERRMSEFMAVSESNRRACSNVHTADVRQPAWKGLTGYAKFLMANIQNGMSCFDF